MSAFDEKVERINADNQPILNGFRFWLEESGLAPKTVEKHVENIDFFAEYLSYDEPLLRLAEADDTVVHDFLIDWFPRKASWASEAYTRTYMASLRKFFRFLRESGWIEQAITDDIQEMLKVNRQEYLEAVMLTDYEDDFGW